MPPHKTTLAIANALRDARAQPDKALFVLERLLLDSLSEQQALILAFVESRKQVNTADVMQAFSFANNHASGLLKELWSYGLLQREAVKDKYGLTYQYRLIP